MKAEVVVFGKWPVPGQVKTRLADAIGARRAARVYRALLDHTLSEARATHLPVTLALVGDDNRSDWEPPRWVAVTRQRGRNLGERMANAFDERFAAGAGAVALVGSDLPGFSAWRIAEAMDALTRVAVVLGPAIDGGYWLIGQRPPGRDLFSSVPWSSPSTAAVTRAKLTRLGVSCEELDVLGDLDTLADLQALLAYDGDRQQTIAAAVRDACGAYGGREVE